VYVVRGVIGTRIKGVYTDTYRDNLFKDGSWIHGTGLCVKLCIRVYMYTGSSPSKMVRGFMV